MDKDLRKERIKQLQKQSYLKRAKEEFEKICPNVQYYDLTDKNEYIQKLESIYATDKEPQKVFSHNINKIIAEIKRLEYKTSQYLDTSVIIFNRRHIELPILKIKLKEFWANFDDILKFIDLVNEESYLWFVLSEVNESFGIFISEDEYNTDSILYWGIDE